MPRYVWGEGRGEGAGVKISNPGFCLTYLVLLVSEVVVTSYDT